MDVLGMYNLTLQANSWDGSFYGLRVGLVQAMMVRSSLYDDDDIEMEAALTRLGYQLVVEGRINVDGWPRRALRRMLLMGQKMLKLDR